MKFILGKKMQSTQIFSKEGKAIPVTLVQAGPCFVTQIKNEEKDGYSGVQIGFGPAKRGFGEKKEKKMKKPQRGHLAKIPNPKSQILNLRWLREFRTEKVGEIKLGDEIKADIFQEGDKVKVSGLSKGKGFQGVVKRHGFRGGPKTHGQKHSLRAPGSIGSTFPERVPKGRRMAGRMGGERVTVENLEVVKADAEENILAIKGALPGPKGTILEISG